jgi:hypothetical protein
MTNDWQDMDDFSGRHRTSVGDDWGAMVIDETGRIAGFVPAKVTPAFLDAIKGDGEVIDAEYTEIERTH